MSKKGALNKVGSMGMQDSFGDAMGSERPWWLPEDLDKKARQMALDTVSALPEKMQLQLQHSELTKISLKERQKLWQNYTLASLGSAEFREQYAKAQLMKPMEQAKIMNANVPKDQNILGEVTHRHMIVVPAGVDDEQWNKGQDVVGERLEPGWEGLSPWGDVTEAEIVESDDGY